MKQGIAGVAAAVVLGLAAAAGAQSVVSDARVAELVALARAQVPAPPPAAGQPVAETGGTDLTLDEAVKRALDRNLDIAVERLNPQVFDLSIAGIRAAYTPTVSSLFGQNNAAQLPTTQLVGGARVQNDTTSYNFGLAQSLPWGGGTYGLTWNNRKLDSTSAFNTFNPQFNSTLTASITQPLLRGLRIDLTRQQLLVTAINRDISEIQLRSTITNTVANTRNAYWDLAAARAARAVAMRSLELAEKLVEDNKVRVEVGTLAPIDIVQAEAEAATRRQAVAAADATARTAELVLKRLIVNGTDDPLWTATLRPVDVPTTTTTTVDVTAAVKRALGERTDLAQARKTLDGNNVTAKYLHNLMLPGLDLIGAYALQGIGGTRFIRDSSLGGLVTGTIPGGFGDALDLIRSRDFPNWTLQMQFSYPIGGSAADANYARAKVQISQAQAQIRAIELQVATDVTNLAVQIDSNLRRVDAARAARELAERRLEAEQSKFEVGMSTNFFVVQAQRDLADAQYSELRAMLDYQRSVVDYERVQQTPASTARTITGVTTGTGTTTRTQ